METTKLPVPNFLSIHVNKEDITIVMRHACERAWFIYSHGSETGPEERLVCIGYFKTKSFEYEFKDIFFLWCMTHQPGTYKMKYESAQI